MGKRGSGKVSTNAYSGNHKNKYHKLVKEINRSEWYLQESRDSWGERVVRVTLQKMGMKVMENKYHKNG